MTDFLPLMTPVRPVTRAQWQLALRRATVGTRVSDCDGDIWTKKRTRADDDLTWLRTGGGWASVAQVSQYAPFIQLKDSDD